MSPILCLWLWTVKRRCGLGNRIHPLRDGTTNVYSVSYGFSEKVVHVGLSSFASDEESLLSSEGLALAAAAMPSRTRDNAKSPSPM
jgi:hypothetical protein